MLFDPRKIIKKLKNDFVREWRVSNLPNKIILVVGHIAFGGWIALQTLPNLKQLLPPAEYPIAFWAFVALGIILYILVFVAAFIEIANINLRTINIQNLLKNLILTALVVTLIWFVWQKTVAIDNDNNSPEIALEAFEDDKGNRFSWGEELQVKDFSSCKNISIGRKEIIDEADTDTRENRYKTYLGRNNCPNDPEARIYLNNIIAQKNGSPIGIVVTLPVSRKNGVADSQEILRGVALAQDDWNETHLELPVVVGIADDGYENSDEETKIAKDVANLLVKKESVLGIVGHFSSSATEATAPIYQEGDLVLISPTSTAVRQNTDEDEITNDQCTDLNSDERTVVCLNSNVFRTVPNDSIHAQKIIDKIENNDRITIVYEQKSPYSRSFKSAFEDFFEQDTNMIASSGKCDFSVYHNKINPQLCLEQAKGNNTNTLLLIPTSKNVDYVDELIKENYSSPPLQRLKLLGGDSMYKHKFLKDENGNIRKDTEGMILGVPWQRKNLQCDGTSRIECKAAELLRDGKYRNSDLQTDFPPLKINWRTATAYDATLALLHGLELANEEECAQEKLTERNQCMRRSLQDTLLSQEFREKMLETENIGALGIIGFDSNGDRLKQDSNSLGTIVEVKNGVFEENIF